MFKLATTAALLMAALGVWTGCASEQSSAENFYLDGGTGGFGGATGGVPGSTGGVPVATGGVPVATGGAPVATGGMPAGSCNVTFCPTTGMGTPCCVSANGPCGFDMGGGCVSSGDPDGG